MKVEKVQYAKTHLSALLAKVEQSEEVVIARGDTAMARLSPLDAGARRELGCVTYTLPDEFFDELPGSELEAWEG